MDFITRKLDNKISLSKSGTKDKSSTMQARIEYMFYFMLGYLWNRNKEKMGIDQLSKIAKSLEGKLFLGKIVGILNELDKENGNYDFLKTYVDYRNDNIGHGYIFKDGVAEFEEYLNRFYEEFKTNVPALSSESDIVVITGRREDGYEALIYSCDGTPHIAQFSGKNPEITGDSFPQVFFRNGIENFKISPFVMILEDGHPYIFNKIEEKTSGKTLYTSLFESSKKELIVPEFKDISIENDFNRTSSNGTIINKFDFNHNKDQYIDVGLLEDVYNFTVKNKANVAAVLWGNGGVGKTACVQELCERFFNESKACFSYIVFASAKERKFDEESGEIQNLKNINSFKGVIETAYSTIFNKKLMCEEKNTDDFEKAIDDILNVKTGPCRGAMLLIVDDFETFADEEKTKIIDFIERMDISKHKVIITTRNKNLASGCKVISTNKLDEKHTAEFANKRMQVDGSDERILSEFKEWIEKDESKKILYEATDGIPLFILQWINLYKSGIRKDILREKLSLKENAVEFLSGKVYDYFSQYARIVYLAIRVVADENKNFYLERLRYVCLGLIKVDSDFDDAFNELIDMYIIHPFNDSDKAYSIYTEGFYADMKQRFETADEKIRQSVTARFEASGKDPNLKLFDSCLKEAGESRTLGETESVVSKYEKAICLPDINKYKKRRAVTELLNYLVDRNEPDKAVAKLYSFGEEISGDLVILRGLIYKLWSFDEGFAIKEIEKHIKQIEVINDDNLTFYSMLATYYIQYNKKKNPDAEIRGIGKKLFDFMSEKSESELNGIEGEERHWITTALLQFMEFIVSSDKELALETGRFICRFSNNFQFRNKAVSLIPELSGNEANSSANDTDPGTVMFVPLYIKYNDSGIPQYLNGTVNGTKAGMPWFDFERFGLPELNKYGGTHAIMENLSITHKEIPAVITDINDKGFYSLSCYQTGYSLARIIDNITESEEVTVIEGELVEIKKSSKFNKLTGQREFYVNHGKILGDDGKEYRANKSEIKKAGELCEGDRVSFTPGINTNPNAGENVLIACNIRKI